MKCFFYFEDESYCHHLPNTYKQFVDETILGYYFQVFLLTDVKGKTFYDAVH